MRWIWQRRWWVLAALVIVALIVRAQLRSAAHQVSTAEAIRGALYLEIAASGRVEAPGADLGFRGSGELIGLYVDEGQRVTASQRLARIARFDPPSGGADSGDVIRAPYDGRIVEIYQRTGAVVAAGNPVLRITADQGAWVTAFVNSEDALYLNRGDHLLCRVGGYLSEPWPITVEAVGSEAVQRRDLVGSAAQVRVRCRIDSPSNTPPAGTEVDVDGRVCLLADGVLIPAAAVVHDGPEDRVWVVETGTAHPRAVTLGRNNFDQIEIRHGIEPGEIVIVRGKPGLTDGMRVRAKPMPPEAEQVSGGE
ncbi:MAG TPA: efflux RND transporter periplasmic adaptor subunit [Armatimonadota bacterium]|nr:efflux RND transporter periplasmic adaptor subunit [Armatimonadota bacterium]HQK94613.1 efflux RND transporter periplasmic adaptor subunit [Armatimonadota bacterium]